MSDCDSIRKLLSPYLDEELEPALSDEVQRHLGACAGCREVAADYRRLGAALRRTVTMPDMTQVWPRVVDRALAVRRRQWRRMWVVRVSAAAAGFLLYLGIHSALNPHTEAGRVRALTSSEAVTAAEPVEVVLRNAAEVLAGEGWDGDAFALLAERPEALLVAELTEGGRP